MNTQQQPGATPNLVPVTADNFIRAETDWYFGMFVGQSGVGKLFHLREPPPIDAPGVRPNRDTLYTEAVFDLDAGPVTITLPDSSGRYMSGSSGTRVVRPISCAS